MSLFRRPRRHALPPEARAALDLDGSARVLAWSGLPDGGWAAATPAGLHALPASGALVDRPWTDVDHAAWDDASRLLAVWWVGARQPTPLELDEGSFLPEVVHERVRASVVLARELAAPGGTVRVALRRSADGTLSTQAVPARGVRMDDPQVERLVARALAELRDEAGAPGQDEPGQG